MEYLLLHFYVLTYVYHEARINIIIYLYIYIAQIKIMYNHKFITTCPSIPDYNFYLACWVLNINKFELLIMNLFTVVGPIFGL